MFRPKWLKVVIAFAIAEHQVVVLAASVYYLFPDLDGTSRQQKQAEAFWASNLASFSYVVLSACANTTNLSLTNKNSGSQRISQVHYERRRHGQRSDETYKTTFVLRPLWQWWCRQDSMVPTIFLLLDTMKQATS